jgi:hypothetical protein
MIAANREGDMPSTSRAEVLEQRVHLSAGPELVGYLPDWEVSKLGDIELNALTRIDYFSVAARADGSLAPASVSGYGLEQLRAVVAAAHAATPPVAVSIVIDWHSPFLAIAQSPAATAAFASNLVSFGTDYQLDGVDLDFEPSAISAAEKDAFGRLLAAVHEQTSTRGLMLSVAVQASQKVIPQAYLSAVDQYNVMAYDLQYDSSAPYDAAIGYLESWASYGVPRSKLLLGVPFYGKSGTSWANSTAQSYASILSGYAAQHGGTLPAPGADSATVNGVTWGYNGVETLQRKARYVTHNGYAGVMVWQLGQDHFAAGGYDAQSLLPALHQALVQAEGPPAVQQVYLSGSTWTPAFKQYLQGKGMGSAAYGYAIPDGPGQSDVLPWINLDQVSITFTADVEVDAGDLRVGGFNVANYALDGAAFKYDTATRTATWRLMAGQAFGNDRIVVNLDADSPGGVHAPGGGEFLDGEWANPVPDAPEGDAWPSGDGGAGGDFQFRVSVLPGDTTRDGTVLADDYSAVKKKFFKNTTDPTTGDTSYSPFHDVDGSGKILAFDFSEVKKRFFNRLPPPADAPLYSFEFGTQGFAPNGSPLPSVSQDTAGATDASHSLRFSLSLPETFSGALTQSVNQARLLDPGTNFIAVDVTVLPGEEEYTGAGFARMGITYFGSIPSQGVFGIPVQTNAQSERSVDLAPGTYTIVIPLISTAGTPFRDAFGTGPDQLEQVSGFQFYINKTNDDAMTVYLDNVRVVSAPAPASAQAPPVASPIGAPAARPPAHPPRRRSIEWVLRS